MEGQETIKLIRMKKWKRFQKEIIAAAYGAMIYNILINRNAKIFRGHNVNIEFLFHQVQITVRERVEIYKEAKFARKVTSYIDRVCNQWIIEAQGRYSPFLGGGLVTKGSIGVYFYWYGNIHILLPKKIISYIIGGIFLQMHCTKRPLNDKLVMMYDMSKRQTGQGTQKFAWPLQ